MSFGGGETIQLSFGPAANAVTSHLCNLQGLAATSSCSAAGGAYEDQSNIPLCDPYVTHATQNDIYVPRVLFVDGRNHFDPWPTTEAKDVIANDEQHQHEVSNWNGQVEIHHRGVGAENSSNNNSNNPFINASATAYNMNNQLSAGQRTAMSQFQTIASKSSANNNNTHSRYHASKYQQVSSQFVYSTNNDLQADATGRCMQWDDDDEEEEEEEEEDEYYKERKRQRELQQWNQYELETQQQLNQTWDTFFHGEISSNDNQQQDRHHHHQQGRHQQQQEQQLQPLSEETPTHQPTTHANPLQHLQWLHYFMAPHPKTTMYTAPLSFDYNVINHNSNVTTTSNQTNSIYSHYCGRYPSSMSSSNSVMDCTVTNIWRETLSDKIRKWLEECDALKGVQMIVDNDKALFAGLGTSVLEELHDECKGAGKLSILVHDGNEFDHSNDTSNSYVNKTADGNADGYDKEQHSNYWRSERKVVNTFRSHINNGLNLCGIGENSDLVLPISLTKCWDSLPRSSNNADKTLFEASAVSALALETMTLPYRLLKGTGIQKQSKVGILNGYYQGSGQSSSDDDIFPTVDRLTFHEFLSSLRPSNSHTMLELSTCMKNNDLNNKFLQGTSIEKRKMEEERERNRNSMYHKRSRGRDIPPGLWIEDEVSGGVLQPLVPTIDAQFASRTMHQHFAMSSSFRPNAESSMTTKQISQYTTLLMEGMGIRYRPQSSVGTIVSQSVNDLTQSQAFAAGTYWKSIFGGGNGTGISSIRSTPLLTYAGNSTRVYSHLKATSNNMSLALSRKYQGYMTRDSNAGIIPESEDCSSALEYSLSLRDTYEPPMMFDEEEGSYFEDNSD